MTTKANAFCYNLIRNIYTDRTLLDRQNIEDTIYFIERDIYDFINKKSSEFRSVSEILAFWLDEPVWKIKTLISESDLKLLDFTTPSADFVK